MSAILPLHTWCGLRANLGCKSEARSTRLAENTRRKKSPKNRRLGTIAQFCRASSVQLRHVSTIGKKLVKQQYLFHMSSQYGELRPTSSWDVWPSPAWAGTLYIRFRGFLPRNGILPGVTFTLRPSLALSYFCSVTARHFSSGRQRNCVVQQMAPPVFGWAAITLGTSPHSSYGSPME